MGIIEDTREFAVEMAQLYLGALRDRLKQQSAPSLRNLSEGGVRARESTKAEIERISFRLNRLIGKVGEKV